MSGLIGYSIRTSIILEDWNEMVNSIFYNDTLIKSPTVIEKSIAIGAIVPSYLYYENIFKNINNIFIWVFGEIYNIEECNNEFKINAISLPDLIFIAYCQNKLFEVLKKIDGVFCGSIYDKNTDKIYLITDRHGLKLLYYYFLNGDFIWCSEVKGINSAKFVNNDKDDNSIKCFLEIGHLLGDNTLFKNIKLTEPASVYEFDVNHRILKHDYYWTWSEVKASNDTTDDAIEKINFFFTKAIQKRVNYDEKIGVSLSGGLDSRFIVSTMYKLFPDQKFISYTFGNKGCMDEKIAKKVAKKVNWPHILFDFNNINWFEIRKNQIIITDGMLDMQHMHGSEFSKEIGKLININLHGYLGDVVLGGSYMKSNSLCNKYPSEDIARMYYGSFYKFSNYYSSYCKTEHIDPFLFINRARRMINMGLTGTQSVINHRIPFFDNDLLEFVYSLSDELRYSNSLYTKLLLRFHKEFFGIIPWQKTGVPLGKEKSNFDKLFYIFKRLPVKIGLVSDKNLYSDYSKSDIYHHIDEIRDILKIRKTNCNIDYNYRFYTLNYYFNHI